jgi:hypothetical protein
MWRNFTQGRIGELDARQYQEVQDAAAQQTWRRRPLDQPLLQRGRTILVKIGPKFGSSGVGGGGQSQVPGAERVRAQAYKFTQVFVRIDQNGTVEVAEREYGLVSEIPGTFTQSGSFYAVDLDPVSNLSVGTYALVVPVDIDIGPPGYVFGEKDFYFANAFVIVALAGSPVSRMMKVIEVLDDQGRYLAVERDPATGGNVGEPVTLYNVYEMDGNNWYDALLPQNQNPCALLDPIPLRVNHWVLATQYAGDWYTIAPTPFKAICQPCGTNPGGALASTYDAAGGEAIASSMMLKGL